MYSCKLEKIFRKTNRVLATIGAVALTIMMVILIVNIITRKFFSAPIFAVSELVGYISLFIGSIGLGQQEWIDNNITMTILVDALSPRKQSLLRAIRSLICFIGFSIVSYYLVGDAINKGITGEVSSSLRIPLVFTSGFMSVCFVFLCVCLAVKTILYFLGYIKYDSMIDNNQEM